MALAIPENWAGTFSVTNLNGELLQVCVSQAAGKVYGQAMISQRTYMRGEIFPNSTWVGTYWKAGGTMEGTYVLNLVDGGTSAASFDGTFFLQGSSAQTTVLGPQVSSVAPPKDRCMQADTVMLAMGNSMFIPFDYNGVWNGVNYNTMMQWNVISNSGGAMTAMYEYVDYSNNANSANGVASGTFRLNGQIYLFTW